MQQAKIDANTSILITGGTGSFGQSFTRKILSLYPDIKRFVIFSRDELKQAEMQRQFSRNQYPGIRYFLGDVRDKARLITALEGIDLVVHAAALKQVDTAEYNPFEVIKTNILGAQNLIEASLQRNVKKIIALSTDKASAPINLYGATKLCSDKLFISANNVVGRRDISFSVVRYGNVMGSRGSVIPYFLEKQNDLILPVTDPRMTRFSITLEQGVNFVIWALENSRFGEVFVPKIPSFKILDLVTAINPDAKIEIIGIRPGEKIHEQMITKNDSQSTLDLGHCYAILAQSNDKYLKEFMDFYKAKKVEENFSYSSDSNSDFLTVEEIRSLINQNVDSKFK